MKIATNFSERKKAFTLVELMIVITIIGILYLAFKVMTGMSLKASDYYKSAGLVSNNVYTQLIAPLEQQGWDVVTSINNVKTSVASITSTTTWIPSNTVSTACRTTFASNDYYNTKCDNLFNEVKKFKEKKSMIFFSNGTTIGAKSDIITNQTLNTKYPDIAKFDVTSNDYLVTCVEEKTGINHCFAKNTANPTLELEYSVATLP